LSKNTSPAVMNLGVDAIVIVNNRRLNARFKCLYRFVNCPPLFEGCRRAVAPGNQLRLSAPTIDFCHRILCPALRSPFVERFIQIRLTHTRFTGTGTTASLVSDKCRQRWGCSTGLRNWGTLVPGRARSSTGGRLAGEISKRMSRRSMSLAARETSMWSHATRIGWSAWDKSRPAPGCSSATADRRGSRCWYGFGFVHHLDRHRGDTDNLLYDGARHRLSARRRDCVWRRRTGCTSQCRHATADQRRFASSKPRRGIDEPGQSYSAVPSRS
jgi:hypothetical protein